MQCIILQMCIKFHICKILGKRNGKGKGKGIFVLGFSLGEVEKEMRKQKCKIKIVDKTIDCRGIAIVKK
jgi:hypothetical protein